MILCSADDIDRHSIGTRRSFVTALALKVSFKLLVAAIATANSVNKKVKKFDWTVECGMSAIT